MMPKTDNEMQHHLQIKIEQGGNIDCLWMQKVTTWLIGGSDISFDNIANLKNVSVLRWAKLFSIYVEYEKGFQTFGAS